MNIFSFCIYGTDMKYYFGLEENCKIINEFYPEYYIYIYFGKTHLNNFLERLTETYSNIYLFETNNENVINMIFRYKPLTTDNIYSIIIRDADSLINERDRYCIDDFIKNANNISFVQVIRDHYWHKSRITGGLSQFINIDNGFDLVKEEYLKMFDEIEQGKHEINYGGDENLLNSRIFPIIKNNILVYSNICVFEGEKYKFIDFLNDGTNFCGNVIEYIKDETTECYKKNYKFNYFEYNLIIQLEWLYNQKQYFLMDRIIQEYDSRRYNFCIELVLYYKILALINNGFIEECMGVYKEFYKYTIISEIKSTLPLFFEKAREQYWKIIGTCDLNYLPNFGEIVIYFGNYPDDYMALPQSYQIYMHFIFKNQVRIDRYEYAECWEKIDRIFIMGLEKEYERMNDTIMQLVFMNAPLDRIHEYRAKKDMKLTDVYIGVTKNHLDCLKYMIDGSYNTCLFLEDDFVFNSNIRENQYSLSTFLNRNYDYNVCFLSASKYHKREDFDDLLILSKQICTTSSGYLIHKNNIHLVYEKVKEGYEKLIETEDSVSYCIDRYWCSLDKLYIFKNKLGFQKPSRSKITGKLNIELD
jgi:hypothetical protein